MKPCPECAGVGRFVDEDDDDDEVYDCELCDGEGVVDESTDDDGAGTTNLRLRVL